MQDIAVGVPETSSVTDTCLPMTDDEGKHDKGSVLCQCDMSCHLEFGMRASPARSHGYQEKIYI